LPAEPAKGGQCGFGGQVTSHSILGEAHPPKAGGYQSFAAKGGQAGK
jgi:hypothetical protein